MTIARRMDLDESGNRIVDTAFAYSDDLKAVADHATAIRNSGYRRDKDGSGLLMEVPAFLVEKYCNDRGIAFTEFMRNPVHATNMMKDPALAHFRTTEERLKGGDAGRLHFLGAK